MDRPFATRMVSPSLSCFRFFFALCALSVIASARAQTNYEPYFFGRFAGNYPGSDDGRGTAARFYGPEAEAMDSAGNIYVADYLNNAIRKIAPDGTVTTLAGHPGEFNYGGADGVGSLARFANPTGVAVDTFGNIYVADYGASTIRKITPGGMVTTIAGSYGQEGSNDGVGSAARFKYPAGIAVDKAGNLFVADSLNCTVRKIDPSGMVTTIAGAPGLGGTTDGTGSNARFGRLNGVTLDAAGNIYVADTSYHTIRKVSPEGVVTTVAGQPGVAGHADGPGAAALFALPFNTAFDAAGNLYVADGGTQTIRKIDASGNVTTLAGSPGQEGSNDGPGTTARFDYPHGVVVDPAGNVYVSDWLNWSIRKVTPEGVVSTFAGLPGDSGSWDGAGLAARFELPADVAVDKAGNVFVADSGNSTIRKITPDGVVTTLAGSVHSPGNQDGVGSAAHFTWPQGIALDGTGNVYVADTGNSAVRKISPDGMVTTVAVGSAGSFQTPKGIAVDPANNIYVAHSSFGTIHKITPAGEVTTIAGQVGSAYRFSSVSGLAADGAGNLYVLDACRISKITPDDVISTVAGSYSCNGSGYDGPAAEARFSGPKALTIDAAGNIYVAETAAHRIRKISPNGWVTTLGGSEMGNVAGAGHAAQFNEPIGIAVDQSGTLYVADYYNHTIRVGIPQTASPQLANISTRLAVQSGDNALIAGFIVTGSKHKVVMLRAMGPSLTKAKIAGALADPTLEVHDSKGVLLAANDDWAKTDLGGLIQANQYWDLYSSGLQPAESPESALIVELEPGAYTAVVRGKNNATGIAIVESYDLDWNSESSLANISTRGLVQTGDRIMIAGTIIRGSGPANVLIRAIGPSLANFGISNALQDPTLELHDGNGALITSNDNWRSDRATDILATTLAPADERESAILSTLPPGAYTAIVRGQNDSSGVAVIEAYQLQ
jgi:sugar lactone lactonase YvrE